MLCGIAIGAMGQSYVGEVLHRNVYQYVKLKRTDGNYTFAALDMDGNRQYTPVGDPLKDKRWKVVRGVETWEFNTTFKNGQLTGTVEMPSGTRKIKLIEQKPGLSEEVLLNYAGIFEDEEGRRAIVYLDNGFLHYMSPYAEETISLKPTGEHSFWSASGESSIFRNSKEGRFQLMVVTDRHGEERSLERQPDIVVENLWIPVGPDTLEARLYMPQADAPVPGCLMLPGGGAIGIDNYRYEARYLASYGIASMIFSKAGNGASKGPTNYLGQTLEQKNERYKAVFRYLQSDKRIDPNNVGIHGPSQGGRLAIMMSIDLGDQVRFAIATAAPLMTLREGQFYAMDHHHRQRGVSEENNMAIRALWQGYYDGIMAGKIDSSLVVETNRLGAIQPNLFLPPPHQSIPLAPLAEDLVNDRQVREASMIKCPLFLQYGENDQRVHPTKSLQNFLPQLSEEVSVKVQIYPRANHSFMTPEQKISPGYCDDKIKWLRQIGVL